MAAPGGINLRCLLFFNKWVTRLRLGAAAASPGGFTPRFFIVLCDKTGDVCDKMGDLGVFGDGSVSVGDGKWVASLRLAVSIRYFAAHLVVLGTFFFQFL